MRPRPAREGRQAARRAGLRALIAAAALIGALALPAAAPASLLQALHGSMGIGYAKLFIPDAPGGSISGAAGLDLPVHGNWRAGVGLGIHLLGTRTVTRGSEVASVDYSLFEAGLFAHLIPQRLGPVGRISFGPEIMSARGELSTTGGGAAFQDLAVEEIAPGAGLDVTFISRAPSPVRVGLELGTRVAFLTEQDWTLATVRLVFHY